MVVRPIYDPEWLEFHSQPDLKGRYLGQKERPTDGSDVVVDGQCGSLHTVFHAASGGNTRMTAEWIRRSHLGEERLELFVPELWDPLPGALTGMFWSADGETTYLSGLGNALLRYGDDD